MRNGIKAFGEQQWQQGRLGGIEEANRNTAKTMINAKEPLEKIISYSHLTKDVIESIAQSLGKPLLR